MPGRLATGVFVAVLGLSSSAALAQQPPRSQPPRATPPATTQPAPAPSDGGAEIKLDEVTTLGPELRKVFGGRSTEWLKDLRLKYDIDIHLRDYLHTNTLLPSTEPGTRTRRDQEVVNAARAEIPFLNLCRSGQDCIAWTLAAEYQRTSVSSNIQVFDYTRNVFSLILSLSY